MGKMFAEIAGMDGDGYEISYPCKTLVPIFRVFTGCMPFQPPNQQCQSNEGNKEDNFGNITEVQKHEVYKLGTCYNIVNVCSGRSRILQGLGQVMPKGWSHKA